MRENKWGILKDIKALYNSRMVSPINKQAKAGLKIHSIHRSFAATLHIAKLETKLYQLFQALFFLFFFRVFVVFSIILCYNSNILLNLGDIYVFKKIKK